MELAKQTKFKVLAFDAGQYFVRMTRHDPSVGIDASDLIYLVQDIEEALK